MNHGKKYALTCLCLGAMIFTSGCQTSTGHKEQPGSTVTPPTPEPTIVEPSTTPEMTPEKKESNFDTEKFKEDFKDAVKEETRNGLRKGTDALHSASDYLDESGVKDAAKNVGNDAKEAAGHLWDKTKDAAGKAKQKVKDFRDGN